MERMEVYSFYLRSVNQSTYGGHHHEQGAANKIQ